MKKPLQIAFRNMDSSDFLEGLVRDKIARLERFHPDLIACRVVLEIAHRKPDSPKAPLSVSIEMELPGRPVAVARAEEARHEMRGDQARAINRAFDAIERQLEDTAEIQDEAVKPHGADGETGVVRRLFREQNYGFVEVKDATDLYFTRNAVVGGDFDALEVGTMVQVTIATSEGPMGPQASSVRRLDARRSVA
jgi:ribosome-associated translation inhibitor RaiA/cold shock CspA family protein